MANEFSKEEKVAFEDVCEKFDDEMVLSENVSKYKTDARGGERSNYEIWRPMPYIAQSFNGNDQSSNFKNITQLSVPGQVNIWKSSPWKMTAKERNDAIQEKRFGDAAAQKLASDINVSVMNVAANQGTLVVKRTAAASGYDDVAQCDSMFNEQGVQKQNRYLALSSRDYNGMASNLAARETINEMPTKAYRNSYVGNISGFETFKLDYANRKAAKLGTTVTINGASQYYTPLATRTAAGGTGETSNVDNRYQDIILDVTSGAVAVGDSFTIADVYAVHHITKQSTGQLKTFRVIDLNASAGASGTMTISPPIISGGGSTDAELMYKNVDSTPANGAALVFLNTVEAAVNPFWYKDSIELLPGQFEVDTSSGLAVIKSTTMQGVTITMSKQTDIKTLDTFYRLDIFYGVVMKQPEMAGIMQFSQT